MIDATPHPSPRSIVTDFFAKIRSGKQLDDVHHFLAPVVSAHQVCSEEAVSIERTPDDYAEHVRAMMSACTDFTVTTDQIVAENDLVYVRWTQRGVYAISDDDDVVQSVPITEFASAVYRVADDKIVEYWMQIDRLGTRMQVERV